MLAGAGLDVLVLAHLADRDLGRVGIIDPLSVFHEILYHRCLFWLNEAILSHI